MFVLFWGWRFHWGVTQPWVSTLVKSAIASWSQKIFIESCELRCGASYFFVYLDTELCTECIWKSVVSATQNTFRLYSVLSYFAVCFKVRFICCQMTSLCLCSWVCDLLINMKLSCLQVVHDPDTSHHIN